MKQLEIKHLACYLPYGLKYHLPLYSERFDSIMEDEPFMMALPFMDGTEKTKHFNKYQKMYLFQENPQIMWDDNKIFLGQMISSLGFEEDDVYLDDVKPILKPISELDKLIKNEFEKYDRVKECDMEIINLFCYENTNTDDSLVDLDLNKLPYECIEYMFRNHYDFFGLIPAGLAIDINTIKKEL